MSDRINLIKSNAKKIFDCLKCNNDIEENIKMPFLNYTSKVISEDEKRINLIFLGGYSSGKTTSINFLTNYISNNNSLSDKEYFSIPTSQSENTYAFSILEKSENNKFKLVFKINDKRDTDIFFSSSLFCKENFNNYNELIKEFPNTSEGIKDLNKFLELIDDKSLDLLEDARKEYLNKDKSAKKIERKPPIIIIKIPNFSNKYRIIDTPGLGIESFSDNLKKIISESEFINVFILVQDIFCLTSFGLEDQILLYLNEEYGKPFIYSFQTKGKKFGETYSIIDRKNKRDYEKFLNLIKKYFDRIKELDNSKANFRKIIPIIDDDYSNPNVQNSIKHFYEDIDYIVNKYILNMFENKYKNTVDNLFFQLKIHTNEKKKIIDKRLVVFEEAKKNIENDLQIYMKKFSSINNYRLNYPDHMNKLKEIFNNNYQYVSIFDNRNHYINKLIIMVFPDFCKLVFSRLAKTLIKFYEEFYSNLNENEKEILIEILNEEKKLSYFFQMKISSNELKFISKILKNENYNIDELITLMIKGYPTYNKSSFFDSLGFWKKINVRDDICDTLIEWFLDNKSNIISMFLKTFVESVDETIKRINDKKTYNLNTLSNIINSFVVNRSESEEFGFKDREFLNLIKDENLESMLKICLNSDNNIN